jgi:hypothetical protein
MSPLTAAHARLACAPRADREPVVIALSRLGWATGRAVAESLKSTLRFRGTPVDVGAALSGGRRDDGGDLVRLGGGR